MKKNDYISWDEYFMWVAILSWHRSKDPWTQVWACIIDIDKKIVWVWYNWLPTWCDDNCFPWQRDGDFEETKYAYVCHAEANAILNSTKTLKWATIYVSLFPCNECAKLIIQSWIKKIVYLSDKYTIFLIHDWIINFAHSLQGKSETYSLVPSRFPPR